MDLLTLSTSEKKNMFKSLIIAAHYDDEVIGLGTRLPFLGNLFFIHTTDSSPDNLKDAKTNGFSSRPQYHNQRKPQYHNQRKKEFLDALLIAGVKDYGMAQSGIADQKAVFYLRYLIDYISSMIKHIKPDVIFTHAYEGGHPDHDATSFAVNCAAKKNHYTEILEFSSYYSDMGLIHTGSFLPSPAPVTEILLTEEEQRLKKRMLDAFETQQETLQYFRTDKELLRISPGYDYSKPPHDGILFYENFDWGVTGAEWRKIVNEYS